MPLMSVVMPARNAKATLAATLDSLVQQSCKDFEVILVDDASTDETPMLAEAYSDRLSIRVISNRENQGVAKSINIGLSQGDSEFVVRLDSDDLARPDRLQKQLDFMRAQPQIDVCGSHVEIFSDEDAQRQVLAHPTSNAGIKTAFVQRCAIAHPSVMARRSFYDSVGTYDPRFDFAEDYELWCRGALLGKQFANIPETLTYYRRHAGQVSKQKAQLQFSRDLAIKNKYLAGWLDGVPAQHLAEFLSLSTQFPTKQLAHAVLVQCTAAMLHLARRMPDEAEYANIVAGSIYRHLGQA
ncbi:MAG TPA: glycosyltransferase [Aquabacterium sp.]|nr:glycosyltransferase [Aquabacterium sp.]